MVRTSLAAPSQMMSQDESFYFIPYKQMIAFHPWGEKQVLITFEKYSSSEGQSIPNINGY